MNDMYVGQSPMERGEDEDTQVSAAYEAGFRNGFEQGRKSQAMDAGSRSQPQPVAQGEAVAWQKRVYVAPDRQDKGGWTDWFECSQGFAESVLKHQPGGRFQDVEIRPLYATPTIPTGHRVVPVEPTEEMFAAFRKNDSFLTGSFATAYKAMIAASPSAGGV